jgi:hypothetical protein
VRRRGRRPNGFSNLSKYKELAVCENAARALREIKRQRGKQLSLAASGVPPEVVLCSSVFRHAFAHSGTAAAIKFTFSVALARNRAGALRFNSNFL